LIFVRTSADEQLIMMVNFGLRPVHQPWPDDRVAAEAFALGGIADPHGVALPVGAGYIGRYPPVTG
jgi:hypothetical protein